jgi:UDP-N-acetylenolpyruvoylglucosamine reductase
VVLGEAATKKHIHVIINSSNAYISRVITLKVVIKITVFDGKDLTSII